MSLRVTQNLINSVVLSNLNQNLDRLMKIQSHLSSGKRILRPSDDPVGTSKAMRLRTRLSETNQYLRNIEQGETQIDYIDNVFNDISGLMMRAQDLAIGQANVTADSRTRTAVAQEVTALIDQFVDLLNTRVGSRYLFAGFETLAEPYKQTETGVTYLGDSGELNFEIESGTTLPTNISGSILMPTVMTDLGGHSSLFPYVERSIPLGKRKLVEFNYGTGVDEGFIQVTNRSGQIARIDLRGVKTLEEVAYRISNTNDLNDRRLAINVTIDENLRALVVEDTSSPNDYITGQRIEIEDIGNGRIARQLGILGESEVGSSVLTGRDLAPIDLTTNLDSLNRGSGVELGKFKITDRVGNSAVVDISDAETLTDVRELINQAGTNIRARINTGGNGILIVDGSSPLAQGTIRITEFGENTHTARGLGILTPEGGVTGNIYFGESLDPNITEDTPIALMNRAQGFDLGEIVVENGPKRGVINFSKAATAGDIIRIINESGLDLDARINDLGTGISVTSIIGGRTLKITDGIGGFTATLLGIQGSRDVLVDPVSPIGAESELLPAVNGETRLSDLNKGRGVASEVIRITDSLGNAQYISITGVNTIQGVLNLINEIGAEGQGLINVVAELSQNQQGISIIDKSISNTVIREITTTGALSADINDLAAGDAIVVNVFKLIDGSETASHMDMVLKPVAGEISLAGTIETIDKQTRQISLRTPDGILYNVLSQQPVDNFFIGQSMHVNGEITPGGDFSARTVALVESPGAGEEQLVGRIESVDLANKTVSLTLEDGSTRQIKLITERGSIKVEDTADGTTAADLGIRGVSVAGSDRIVGSALDPLITTNTKLSLLNGGTFIPGKIRIANGDRDVVVDLSNAETINELLALINNSAAAVVAAINDAGTGISLRSRINGTTLMVTKTTLKNPDRSNKVYPDGTTIFDETADLLALTGSEDIVGNLLFLRNALLENNQQDIQKTLSKFPQGLNRILNQRTKIGARANQLETTQDRGLDSNLINTEILSRTEDLDVVEAISELAARENAFNAALGAASRIILPSLLDYL